MKTRLEQLEEQVQVQAPKPRWIVHIDTIGMPEEEADRLRAEAERLGMPEEETQGIRIVEVRCPQRGIDDNWAERGDRLEIWGRRTT